jgi:putative oxidoreductase
MTATPTGSGAVRAWAALTARLDGAATAVPPLLLRAILGWEFWESGLEKYRGDNWFAGIQADFPFPFDVVPPGLSWFIATWFELIGAVLLWLGLGTRFIAYGLLVLTFVATAAVHWPDMLAMWDEIWKGYAISDKGYGNFKLPLLFAVMLLPLVFGGAGRISVDALLARRLGVEPQARLDAWSWALAAAALAVPFLLLVPTIGSMLAVVAVAMALAGHGAARREP